ncbi:MAG: hypothetical protein H8F28_05525 [Fibrella sp.]|nr:hypothetical protein [Armatimonadota bacterium]
MHDASGGRGIAGSFQKPVNSDFVGFAGGIRPENIREKLEQIEDLGFDNPFWIDLESGIRTENVFDLEKVERLLRTVKPFVRTDVFPTK